MLETIFGSILTASLTGSAFVICLLVALALGALVAAVYMYKNTYTQSMAVTLALLPAMVQVIILLVNGNLGAGVAVSGLVLRPRELRLCPHRPADADAGI